MAMQIHPQVPKSEPELLDAELTTTVEELALVARGVVEGFLNGLHRSPFLGHSSEFDSYRPYMAGDNLRYLDWRMWGRTDKLYVKQFEDNTNLRAQILLDTSASMAFGTPEKFGYARTLAAALSYLLVHQHDAPGLVLFGDKADAVLPGRCRAEHMDELLAVLQRVVPSGRTCRIGSLAEAITTSLGGRRGLAIVISDLLSPDQAVFDLLRQLQLQGRELMVFHIVAPEEMDFDFQENFEMEDAETGERVRIHASSFRQEYLRRFQAFLSEAKQQCEKLEADYCLLRTDQYLERALAVYLEARMEA
jgi:uncharacterized protein (DUF58 family)